MDTFKGNKIYLESQHSGNLQALEALTRSRNWDSEQFDKILVALGLMGNGQSIPAINRPESIHLQKYRKYFDELLRRTKDTNREHCRTIFIDNEKKSVVMSNKISVGTNSEVAMHVIPQPGRELFQTLIGSVHTHPIGAGLEYGLSDQDYKSFLYDPKQQFMIIAYGENVRMLVFKTSVTPNNITRASIDRRIADTSEEFLSSGNLITQFVDFNKTICLEFGLTFYMATKNSNDLFERINVVS